MQVTVTNGRHVGQPGGCIPHDGQDTHQIRLEEYDVYSNQLRGPWPSQN